MHGVSRLLGRTAAGAVAAAVALRCAKLGLLLAPPQLNDRRSHIHDACREQVCVCARACVHVWGGVGWN